MLPVLPVLLVFPVFAVLLVLPVLPVVPVLPVPDEPPLGAAGLGFGLAFRAGTDAPAWTAVTEASGAWTETAGASEGPPCDDEPEFVAAPIANAAPNETATTAISNSQRFLTEPAAGARVVAPKLPCIPALLSICHRPLRVVDD
jgi:hypothetical protein